MNLRNADSSFVMFDGCSIINDCFSPSPNRIFFSAVLYRSCGSTPGMVPKVDFWGAKKKYLITYFQRPEAGVIIARFIYRQLTWLNSAWKIHTGTEIMEGRWKNRGDYPYEFSEKKKQKKRLCRESRKTEREILYRKKKKRNGKGPGWRLNLIVITGCTMLGVQHALQVNIMATDVRATKWLIWYLPQQILNSLTSYFCPGWFFKFLLFGFWTDKIILCIYCSSMYQNLRDSQINKCKFAIFLFSSSSSLFDFISCSLLFKPEQKRHRTNNSNAFPYLAFQFISLLFKPRLAGRTQNKSIKPLFSFILFF